LLTILTRRESGLRASPVWLLLLITIVLTTALTAAEPGLTQKRVVVMYPTRSDAPVPKLQDPIYRKVLDQGLNGQLDYHSEFIDLLRFPQPAYQAALFDLLSSKYKNGQVDLVITLWTPPPNEFAAHYRPQLFPKTPVVYIYRELHEQEANSTGIYYDHDVKRTMEMALTLQPDTKQVYVVVGSSQVDKNHQNRSAAQFQEFADRVEVNYLTDIPMSELLNRVAKLPPNSILFYQTVTEDSVGNRFITTDVLDQIAAVADVPIYSSEKIFLDHGIVGGGLLDNEVLAAKAAEVGLQVLNGQSAASIPIAKVDPYVTEVDWRQLKRWGLDESRLPVGTTVSFKPPNLWEQYKWQITGAITFSIFQTFLIAWLLFAQNRRRAAEKQRNTFQQLAAAEQRRIGEIVSNTPGVVWEALVDRETGERRIHFISDYIEKMSGYSVKEWLSTPNMGTSLVAEEDRDLVTRAMNAVVNEGQGQTVEYRWLAKNGKSRWVEANVVPIRDETGKTIGLRGFTMDISDRKEADEAARQSEAQFRLMADTAPVLIWVSDAEMRSTFFNWKCLEFTGRSMEELSGEGWLEIVHNDDRQQCRDAWAAANENRETFVQEYRIRHADGEFRWIYVIGTPRFSSESEFLGYIGSCVDITNLKLAQEAVRDLSRKLMNAQEKERARLARELHDDLSQSLALLAIQMVTLRNDPNDLEYVKNQLDELISDVYHLAGDIRRISHELHPAKLSQLGLEAALDGFCREISATHPVEIDFEAENLPRKLSDDISLCLYRVAQESLQNVIKHSKATAVNVSIKSEEGKIHLSISDNGKGFDTEARNGKESLGLISIDERVRAVEGLAKIISTVGEGTIIEVQVPNNQ
jgi:PAS domain S-box-containing protein